MKEVAEDGQKIARNMLSWT